MNLIDRCSNIAFSFFGSMQEVYVTAGHDFHHMGPKHGKFVPFINLSDPMIFIRPVHSYLGKKITFEIATILPSHSGCPFK